MSGDVLSCKQAKVAVLIACHNRREKTLRCISSTLQEEVPGVALKIFLTDDGSTDGTGDAVRSEFPTVRIVQGDGNLFWCRGMEKAWHAALREEFDGFLWLNDDVELSRGALTRLFAVVAEIESCAHWPAIIVGSTTDPETGNTTYGGYRRTSRWHPGKLVRIEPHKVHVLPVDTLNGNIVYVPSEVVSCIGIIDPTFSHATGDLDYGLKAKRSGISVLLAPGHFGTCARNRRQPLSFRSMFSRKGLPWRDWLRYTRRYGQPLIWVAAFLMPYIRMSASATERKLTLPSWIRRS